jgi:3-hydroxy-9,10-secoandrosta-1,3,5(10)-triene-9,17-dione monooxygenase reductase component
MGHFATGVAVVTSRSPDGRACGLTVNALASVSLDPPLILVCLAVTSATHDAVLESGSFAVNVLDESGADLAERFSRGRRASRFRALELHEEVTGAPVLDRALAWLDCRVHAVHEAGDHSIVVGRVQDCGVREGRVPLLFYRGRFGGASVEGPS